jgi:hypothetical protein
MSRYYFSITRGGWHSGADLPSNEGQKSKSPSQDEGLRLFVRALTLRRYGGMVTIGLIKRPLSRVKSSSKVA